MILYRRYVGKQVVHAGTLGKPIGNGWYVHRYQDQYEDEARAFAGYVAMRSFEYLRVNDEGRILGHLLRKKPP